MADPSDNTLAPHYYRDNFLHLCDTVEAQYADLFSPPEHLLLQRFRNLEFEAQCLYVRLVSRVGPWFRESKLAYAELGELASLVDVLLEQGMLLQAAELPLDELGRLYTRRELQQAFSSQLRVVAHDDKGSLLAAIGALPLAATETLELLSAPDTERLVAPWGLEQVRCLQLLFFGNRRQSLTEFVLSDLGVARYYSYALDRDQRLFPRREALDEYLTAAALSDRWYELREAGQPEDLLVLADHVLAADIVYPSSEGRWDRLCNAMGRDLERHGEMDRAYRLYGRSQRHPARERRARVLEKREDWTGAVTLCEEILANPWCEGESEAASRILPRVRRKLDGSRVPRRRDKFPEVRLFLSPGTGPVELQAADHLRQDWQSVYYVENKLMNALFGLAFWEQIFTPVPGAFHNPYQSVPSDMYESTFRLRRRDTLAARMAQLRETDIALALREAYQRYVPLQCRWVDWRRVDADLVDAAARVIPDGHLLSIWERMLFDPGENRRGFPDLIGLGEQKGDYCLVEIKGPGDTLQDSQKRWLRYFQAQGIPAQVAWVEWQDD